MKKLFTLLFVVSYISLSAQYGLLAGTGYAPNFTATDLNGNTHTIYDYLDSGKVVVLELMSVTCGHCISHAAGTENSYLLNGPSGSDVARFLGLEVNSSTDSSAVANFANSYGVTFPLANNISPAAINYQLYYTPGYYVIYPDSSYTTICAAYCVTAQNSSTIEGILNSAIAAWPPIYGCTDPSALNYDSLATVDNDSCDYSSYTITTSGMNFVPDTIVCDVGDTINFIMNNYHNAVEVSDSTWIANGTAPLVGGFNIGFGTTGMFIPDDCHTFYYVCQPHVTMGMKGVIIAHHPPAPGCTDSLASNYDSTATVDDGSCVYTTFALDLFISEYGEGSGYNKYIEIYNGTGQSVDLANYEIWKITNGGSWPEYTLSLSGNLAHGDVYIVCHSSSSVNPYITGFADQTWSQASWTGDDAVGLAKNNASLGASFALIDVIGEDGSDPGNGWNVAGVTDATKDHTLVRKCSVIQGNINWSSSAGTNPQDSEWEVLPQNDWSDLHMHTFPCQSTSVYGCTDSTALNYDPLATADDGSCLFPVYGCMDATAFNYDSLATVDDGSCCFVTGCTNILATNYDSTACYDDGSCIVPVFGCMDPNGMNYDSLATASDTSCVYLADKEDLFFSEYGEGSSNNKWLEIYNPTNQNIDLSSYALARVSNAPTTIGVYEYWVDFPAGEVILANDVYVVAHPSSSSPTPPFGPGNSADWFYSALSNGDDGFALVYGAKPDSPVLPGNEYIILDHIGDFNGDPGSGWDVAGVTEATKDHTLIRKCYITQGNDDWVASAGTDSINSEWEVYPQNDWTDIGQHTYCPPIYGCTDSAACNYDVLATVDDGSCLTEYGCTDSTATNYNPLATCDDGSCIIGGTYGCTDSTAFNYDPNANVDDGSCVPIIYGCTDPVAMNYYAGANTDDGSCAYSNNCNNPTPTGTHVIDIIHTRARVKWDNMSSFACTPEQYRVRYRDYGSSNSWSFKNAVNTNNCGTFNQTGRLLTNLTPGTTYEYQVKAWYCNTSGSSTWSPLDTFSTAVECPNVGNFAVSTPLTTRAVFTWDDSNGPYSFCRIKLRVDSISNPTGADWQNAGGFGVNYPTFTRNKNGLTPGETYRGQSRTWCDPQGGPYKSSGWTPLIFWTQPTSIRLSGETAINNLEIYPNPSRDIFNIRFTSEEAQDLQVRILNVIGEEVSSERLQQFEGEYVRVINLNQYPKGIYLLEIETDYGVINKKLIIQ